VYAKGNFTNGRDLAALLRRMIDETMPTAVAHDAPIRLHGHLTYEEGTDVVRVSSRQTSQTFADVAGMREVARAVAAGDQSAGRMALALESEHGLPLANTFFLLNTLFSNGVLNDEPEPTSLGHEQQLAR
jgi:hypothetical protein